MKATIDIKTSAIIASSFAFLSSRISLPYLNNFIDTTPVYHHFTISDPIFTEHLSSIISNLGELGFDWFQTLLYSFLKYFQTSSDRYLIKSIAAVIKHDPITLFNETLKFIYEKEDYKYYLSLISFIINSNQDLQNANLDLYKIAKTAMDVLDHLGSCNATQIDSAMQVLVIHSNFYQIETNLIESQQLEIELKSINNEESLKIRVDISNLVTRPSFYLFDLPIEISKPEKSDALLTFSAKMNSLAKRANKHPEESKQIFDIFVHYYNPTYNENVSAVLQGISVSISTMISKIDHKNLIPFLESAIFSSPSNWFHSSDQLTLIKHIPPESFTNLFGPKGLKRIGLLLINLALSHNEQVSKKSIKAMKKLVTENNFKDLTLLISKHIDIYDSFNLIHLLPLLSNIIENMKDVKTDHLNFFVLQLFELTDLYSNELNVLTEIFFFFGCFNLYFVNKKIIKYSFHTAVSIIFASITAVTGFSDWTFNIPADLLKNSLDMINVDIRSKNIDVSSEDSLDYSDFLRPCVSAMKFIYAIPIKLVTKDFILTFYDKLRNIFPYESALFIQKYWDNLHGFERVEAVIKMQKSLRFIQDYKAAALVCRLYIKVYRIEYKEKLKKCTEGLREIAEFVKDNPKCTTDEQRTLFKAITYFTNPIRGDPSAEFEKDVIENIPDLYSNLFNKLIEKVTESPIKIKEIEEEKFVFKSVPDLNSKLDFSDPCIKTQIIHSTRQFSDIEYQQLLKYYVENNDISGIDLIIRCCYTNKIKLDISGLIFPKKSIPVIIRYLKGTKSPELNSFLDSLTINKEQQSNSLQRALIYAKSDQYLEIMKTAEKIKKEQMKMFAQMIYIHGYPENELIESTLHCFSVSKSVNKLRYSLKILMNVLARLELVNDDFVEKIISIFVERENDLDTYCASMCLLLTVKKLREPNEKLNIFITHLIASISQAAPEICILYSALSIISKKDPLFNQTLPKIIEHFFSINRPSLFAGASQLFSKSFEIVTTKNLDYLLKKCFPEILQLLPKFSSLYTVSEKTIPVIMHVFKMGNKKQQLSIFNSYASLIPQPSSAVFVFYASLLGCFISYADGTKWMLNDFNNLINLSHQMLTSPGNENLLHLYIKIIAIRAKNINNIAKKQSLVMNEIDAFLDKGLKFCDFYRIHHTVFDWCILLLNENGFSQTLPIISSLIFKKSPRFFPAFYGVAIFINYYRNLTKNSRDKAEIESRDKLNATLLQNGKAMFQKSKVHGLAIALLSYPELYKNAITLALLESDNEKSNQIVDEVLKNNPDLFK